jgi:hypothetical protein
VDTQQGATRRMDICAAATRGVLTLGSSSPRCGSSSPCKLAVPVTVTHVYETSCVLFASHTASSWF